MKNVYIELLSTAIASTPTTSTQDLFNASQAVNKATTLSRDTLEGADSEAQRLSKRQAREFVHGFVAVMAKGKESDGLRFTFPNGTTVSYATKTLAITGVRDNFAIFYPAIL